MSPCDYPHQFRIVQCGSPFSLRCTSPPPKCSFDKHQPQLHTPKTYFESDITCKPKEQGSASTSLISDVRSLSPCIGNLGHQDIVLSSAVETLETYIPRCNETSPVSASVSEPSPVTAIQLVLWANTTCSRHFLIPILPRHLTTRATVVGNSEKGI